MIAISKSRPSYEFVDRAVEVAPPEQAALQRSQAALPSRYRQGWRAAVLDKVQLPRRAEHPMDLGEGTICFRDRAQSPGNEHVIDAGRVDGQAMAVQSHVFDGNRAGGHAPCSQLPAGGCGVDGLDPSNRGRVVGGIRDRSRIRPRAPHPRDPSPHGHGCERSRDLPAPRR